MSSTESFYKLYFVYKFLFETSVKIEEVKMSDFGQLLFKLVVFSTVDQLLFSGKFCI